MDTRRGTFIVLEGTDGSGKGTQAQLLAEQLKKAGYEVATFDFPQYGEPSSYFVQQYLNGAYGQADEVGPYTSSLFYALDRYQSAQTIREALAAGKIVLANRFTGSNMAHQGTKFSNAEERRGFFIWLDNLEFEMLKIPRPDISFVLRVPAATAQTLVDAKPKRTYTDQKRDIHEADLAHLERSVTVYDELCQLFPRDFIQIDCLRNGQLLSIEAIHRLLWQKVSPLLPAPAQLEMPMSAPLDTSTSQPEARPAQAPDAVATPTSAPQQASDTPRTITRNVSHLFAAQLLQNKTLDIVDIGETNVELGYITPKTFDSQTAADYNQAMQSLLISHAKLATALQTYVLSQNTQASEPESIKHSQRQARYTAALVLPAASLVGLQITNCNTDTHVEPLYNQAVQDFYQKNSDNTLRDIISKCLPGGYSSATPGLRLVSYSPRNELAILPDMLYSEADQDYSVLRDSTENLPYKQKAALFEALQHAVSDRVSGLGQARYDWEIVSDMQTLCILGHNIVKAGGHFEMQPPTPRYGYNVPQLIEDANLTDEFETCFERSLTLHSQLEQAGYRQEAQYATLIGHFTRWRVSLTADSIRQLFAQTNKDPSVTLPNTHAELLNALARTLVATHPLLAACILPASNERN